MVTEVGNLVSDWSMESPVLSFHTELASWHSRCVIMGKNTTGDSEMLKALLSISGILQGGFESLKLKVGEVNTNISKMDDSMNKQFDSPVADSDESDHEE